jgi:hypothetical protein
VARIISRGWWNRYSSEARRWAILGKQERRTNEQNGR